MTSHTMIVDTICEAYSEHYTTYSVEAVINLLDELFPADENAINLGKVLIAIRKKLKKTYNII